MNLSEISKLTEEQARETLERIVWSKGVVCPHCGRVDGHTKLQGKKHRAGVWKCSDGCAQQFSVTVGTVMEGSHLPVRTWLMAFSILCSAKKGVSALQLQRQLGLGSYRSAWHLCHRIRYAMSKNPLKGLLEGTVMVDETYVGGKARKERGPKRSKGYRHPNKVAVVALVERGGRVKTWPIADVTAKTLQGAIRDHVAPSAAIQTDQLLSYKGVGRWFDGGHETVNHAKLEYVRGDVSTNEVESYFALLKRGITGSFHSVSKQHLHRYCSEFSYRWNERKVTDAERTAKALGLIGGGRLMYKDPIRRRA
ncbi:MAG TPA: IS1595 family transposase [Rhizomicrobium sp.]|jgi:transposase-like protein|nr:IS1595 family transposase [Rhizomicrobium sp.]